ncbi:MAG: sigma-54-dependent Fis family transcriptional regulator [Planctomycetes bacterium]|uniref:response regulator n=1 Tax=Candidatus Wunengus sp. YC65 TaxID=3367701 RepID=UPI001DBD1769|nr:sigma-54-dependent Fis family transcriptional regulator [Planctomycetota bacterium]MBI5795813.1 sigma-54-dependent Fis family transcriptional regulator [Planctomycetota bacterium]
MDTEFKKPVILVVDDESDMCEMFVTILYEEGYVTDIVNSGKDAVKKVKDGGVDFVLLDIMMPEMSGIETLQQIKAVRPDIPVVMITAYATLKTAQESMRLGAYDYITKPFNLGCVMEVIKQGLEEQYTNT